MPDYGPWTLPYPLFDILGQTVNATASDVPAFSNASFLGLAGLADTAAALTTAVCTSVAVPVPVGVVISKVSVVVGATAANTPVNGFAALYSGIATPARLTQATDITSTAIAASALFTYTLAAPTQITAAIAPQGFVYVSLMSKATGVPSLATVSVAAAVGYQWYTTGPLFVAATHGSALTATAPSTIASPVAQAAVPLVILT